MSRLVISIAADATLTDVADTFIAQNVRRLPVVEANDKMVGVISRHDLIRFVGGIRDRIRQSRPAAARGASIDSRPV
jgi:CBS-domain-containing membrane protein